MSAWGHVLIFPRSRFTSFDWKWLGLWEHKFNASWSLRNILRPAPKAVVELTNCGCKGDCKRNCSCHRHSLPCTPLCKCGVVECSNAIRDEPFRVPDEDCAEWLDSKGQAVCSCPKYLLHPTRILYILYNASQIGVLILNSTLITFLNLNMAIMHLLFCYQFLG